MKLVICEKPSVGAAVAAALGVREKKDGYIKGNGYFISWCIGHLVGLAEAAVYGEQYRKWSYDSLPILPQEWQYTVAADKGKQFKILKDLIECLRIRYRRESRRQRSVFHLRHNQNHGAARRADFDYILHTKLLPAGKNKKDTW